MASKIPSKLLRVYYPNYGARVPIEGVAAVTCIIEGGPMRNILFGRVFLFFVFNLKGGWI